jgi:hypothetical protein
VAKYVGTVTQTDVEGGAWTLVTNQGVVYQLKGGGPDLLVDGVRAEIDGEIATDQVGIAMVGDILEVKSYRIIG